MRKYSKRRSSTSAKTYQDYLNERQKLLDKGYYLKDKMSKQSFENYYDRIREAKRSGEIKSQPWQYLISKEKYISAKQAKTFALARTEKEQRIAREKLESIKDIITPREFEKELKAINKIKYTAKAAQRFTDIEIQQLGAFITATKAEGLYGGDYE